jgi:hypothetical protein
MANNTTSNFTEKLMRKAMPYFESKRVLSKNVNTQFVQGGFGRDSGDKISVTRPVDHVAVETATGDLSAQNTSPIIAGKAYATVQDYITVYMDYAEAVQALEFADEKRLTEIPAMNRLVTKLETNFARFAMKNTNLVAGAVGTPVTTWGHVAESAAIARSIGIPDDKLCCFVNPYTEVALADGQRSLGVNPQVGDSDAMATIKENFAGMKVMTATTLASYTTGTGADRAGTLSATPTATYVAAKDSMTQSLAVTGFQANLVVAAGETITVTGRNRLNLSTREQFLDNSGAAVLFSGTVTEAVTLGASGEGTLVIAGAGIFEAGGAYNTVASALTSGDVVTLGGAASTVIQPNLFWHKDAFTIASVPIEKLYSTDTLYKTRDGLQIRCSMGSDIITNKQIIRFDIRPAFGVMNQFLAGQLFGRP